jgi:lipoprotein-anchoring transpeptidase ErfK/SrfK
VLGVRSATFIAVVTGLILLVGAAGGVYAYDRSREDTIADGVKVGGVDLGGLSRAAATRRLRARLYEPLKADVVVRVRGQHHTLTAAVAGTALHVGPSIDEALRRSRSGNVLSRTLRKITGGSIDADVQPEITYSEDAVRRLVARVARNVDRDVRDATVKFAGDGIRRVRSRTGIRLNRATLTRRVEAAVVDPDPARRQVRATVRKIRPKVTTGELADRYRTVVTIDRGHFTLRLFKRLKLVRTYGIAVGRVGLETPAGMYKIQNKVVDPAWNVPDSPWAGKLAGTVVPGGVPENPLKARWMGIYNGAGIHGTAERGSIGSNASHGCIRMLVEDVIQLYDDVSVGTRVYIA